MSNEPKLRPLHTKDIEATVRLIGAAICERFAVTQWTKTQKDVATCLTELFVTILDDIDRQEAGRPPVALYSVNKNGIFLLLANDAEMRAKVEAILSEVYTREQE